MVGHKLVKKLPIVIVACVAVLLSSACAPIVPAEVVEREVTGVKQQTDKIGGAVVRIVQPGDTLYGLAFASGLDAKDLAAWNGLSLDNRIQVGQKLRLTKPLNFVPKPSVVSRPISTTVNTTVNQPNVPPLGSESPKVIVGIPKRNPTVAPAPSTSVTGWRWPLQGKLIRRFALSQGQQGVDIQGALGQSVMAGAAGEVVYVGNGLKGYGNLIIIKHDDEFLSAYAHNQAVFVKEGELVKQSSVIASVGNNQRGEPALQFQIRKRGTPVNPLGYLPKIR